MGNAPAYSKDKEKSIFNLDNELDIQDSVPPIIKETSLGKLTKKANSSGKSNDENELMTEQLLGFNINNLFESKARKNNADLILTQNEESQKQSDTLPKSKKIIKSTSDYILDNRLNRRNYSMGGSSVETSKHTDKLADIENFITDSSSFIKEKQISYQEYEKLFGMILSSDESQVIETIRKYKQQFNIPVDQDKKESPEQESISTFLPVSDLKPKSDRKKLPHAKQITSRSEFGAKTDRSSSSANSKLAKPIPKRDKSVLSNSKIPRVRKSVLNQPLITLKNESNRRRKSIVKSQHSAVESNSIVDKSDSSLYYSAVDTNIKSSKSKRKQKEDRQDKLSLSVISSQASPKSYSEEESKRQRSISPSSNDSDDDSKSENLTKLNTPEEDERQLFESPQEIVEIKSAHMIFRSKSLPKKPINSELAVEFQYHVSDKRRNSIKMSCLSGVLVQLEQWVPENHIPQNEQPEIKINVTEVENQPQTVLKPEDQVQVQPIDEPQYEAKIQEVDEEELIDTGIYDRLKCKKFSDYSKAIDKQQRLMKDKLNWIDPRLYNRYPASRYAQSLKIDDFRTFVGIISDLKVTKVTDWRVFLKNDSMEILLNKAKFIDSMFNLTTNEYSTSASSGNMEDKKVIMPAKKNTDQTPLKYYPFNPSFLRSSQLEPPKDNDQNLLEDEDEKEQEMIMEMIKNNSNQSKSLNFGSKIQPKLQEINDALVSKTLPINIKDDEIKKLAQSYSNQNSEEIYDICHDFDNEIESAFLNNASLIQPPMLLPKVKQSPTGLDDLFSQPKATTANKFSANIPDLPKLELKSENILLKPNIDESDLNDIIESAWSTVPNTAPQQANKVTLPKSEDWETPQNDLITECTLKQENKVVKSTPVTDIIVEDKEPILTPWAPKNITSQATFQFDQLEDMGEIIDIGFDEDIDTDLYLNAFNSNGKKQKRNVRNNPPKSPAKSQEVEEGKQITISDSFGPMPAMTIDPNEFIMQNLRSDDLMLQVNTEYPLNLNFKKTKSHNIWNSELNFGPDKNIEILNNQQKDQILLHLLKERGWIKEKLRMAESEINMKQNHIERMKRGESDLPTDMSKASLHLAFLFSSPLIRRTTSSIENIMQLDYSSEISDILKVWSRRKYELKYKIDVATMSNMRSTITDCPIALHFSGHGIQNTAENLGTEYAFNKNKGNILLLENEHGMADYFYEEDIKYMIEMSKNTFEVVFVSSWYSQFAGEVFLNAGAKHAICIKTGERISDKASLRFSRVFYETLFVKNYNVCTAFHIAKEEINKVINPSEANKFKLLIHGRDNTDGNVHNHPHKCYALSNFNQGQMTNIDNPPIFDAIPSNVDCFLGRQQDMYEIINLLDFHRLVSILGPPGIGKTSISRNLANYLKDRKKFSDGIIYVPLRGCESAQMFLTRLCLLIRTSCSIEEYKKYGLEEIDKKSNNKNTIGIDKDDESKYRNFILQMLRDKEVLLILDNAEDPLEDDTTRFVSELDSIIDNCNKIKFLVTTRKTINKLAHNHEKPYVLQPLSKEASLKLLIAKAPREIKNPELQELLQCTIPKRCKITQSLNIKLKDTRSEKVTLLDHPFTALLGGHPQAISLAAPLLEYKSLKNLFYAFCDSNLMDAMDYAIDSKDPNTSLRVSLELSINHMKNTMPDALNLFSFIGLLPGGVNDEELTQMWGNTEWMGLKDSLIRASLLVFKTDSKGLFVYSMLPFMSIRAYELLEQNEERRHDYHMKWCKMFKEYCFEFYQSDRSISNIENLIGMESNIWACIYRSVNRKKNIKYENDDLNGNNSDYFTSDNERSLERLSVTTKNIAKKYRENEEINTMEKLIEEENESSSDELNDSTINNILNSSTVNVDRSSERNYKSHFRMSPKADDRKNQNEDNEAESKINATRKNGKRRPRPKMMSDMDTYKKSKFFDEEMLVIYYATNLVLINKNGDALKAVSEYLTKRGISELSSANLYKLYAVLLLMNKNQTSDDIQKAVNYFKKAGGLFYKIGCKKGLGLCKFGLAKIHYECWPELMNTMNDKSEDMLIEASLNFAQNALKLFKQVAYVTGEYHSDKFEEMLKRKMNIHDRGIKGTQYYMDLAKRAQKEIGKLQENSWINAEISLLLNIVLDDFSHLQPNEQHLIKKINGTLVNVQNKRHHRVVSKIEKFDLKNVDTRTETSKEKIQPESKPTIKHKHASKHITEPSSISKTSMNLNIKTQAYKATTPFKENRSKSKMKKDYQIAKLKTIVATTTEPQNKDDKKEIWKF